MLGAINLENDAFTLVEDKEINLDPTVQVLGGHRGTLKGIAAPGVSEK